MGIEQEPDDEKQAAVETALAIIRGEYEKPAPTFETPTLEDNPAGMVAKLECGFLEDYLHLARSTDVDAEADKFLSRLASWKAGSKLRIEAQIVDQITTESVYRRALEIRQAYTKEFIEPENDPNLGKVLNNWESILKIINHAVQIERSRQKKLASPQPADKPPLPQGVELTEFVNWVDQDLRKQSRDRTTPVRKPPEQLRLEREVRGFITDFLEFGSVENDTLKLAKLFKSNFEDWAQSTPSDMGKLTLMRAKLVTLEAYNEYLGKVVGAVKAGDKYKRDWYQKKADQWWSMLEVIDFAINLET